MPGIFEWTGSAFVERTPHYGEAVSLPSEVTIWDPGLAQFVKVWPTYQESVHEYTVAGSFTLPIPSWARYADVAVIGGGGGGGGRRSGSTNTGKGGGAAAWFTAVAGPEWVTAHSGLTITVGDGGAGGPTSSPNTGIAGGQTRVWFDTNLFSGSSGGTGGAGHTSGSPTPGANSVAASAFGITFPGATGGDNGSGSTEASPGGSPGAGGGGAGGGFVNPARAGGQGGAGRAYIRFRSM